MSKLSEIDRIILRATLALFGSTPASVMLDSELLCAFAVAFEGRKIQGIKHIRTATGLNLKDAKDTFERLFNLAARETERAYAARKPLDDAEKRLALTLLARIETDALQGETDDIFAGNVKGLREIIQNA